MRGGSAGRWRGRLFRLLATPFAAGEPALGGLGRFDAAEVVDVLGVRLRPAIGQDVAQSERVDNGRQAAQDVRQVRLGIQMMPLGAGDEAIQYGRCPGRRCRSPGTASSCVPRLGRRSVRSLRLLSMGMFPSLVNRHSASQFFRLYLMALRHRRLRTQLAQLLIEPGVHVVQDGNRLRLALARRASGESGRGIVLDRIQPD